MTPRLKERYQKEIVPALEKEFKYSNRMAVPRVRKVVVNMGLGEAIQNAKLLDSAGLELGLITGQRAVITRARKSIANFKLRKNMPIGAMVTLRGDMMYEFLDRLMNVALPRVRDFRGLSARAFDGRGNYTLGLRDQLVFPEVDYSKVDKVKGMNIYDCHGCPNGRRGYGAAAPLRHAVPRRRAPGGRGTQREQVSRREQGRRISCGATFANGEAGEKAQVQDPTPQPVPALRQTARLPAGTSILPGCVSANWPCRATSLE